ncbi:MAG: cytochrome c oxidase, subunit [Deltaproteobacteria bacterium]|nr:cytochrome c oxidase, subunit [Deltaproteobacteria bacterium]
MNSFARYAALIVVTGLLALGVAIAVWGLPDAVAQPAAVPAGSAAPAAPVTPAGSAAPADGSAVAPAAGSAAPTGAPAPAAPAAEPPAVPIKLTPWYEILANQPVRDDEGNFWMPKAVNLEADSTDQMFYAVYALSVFFFLAITIAVVYFCIKYRHRPGHKAEPSAGHNDALEITWTVIPTIICVFLFYYGWRTYVKVVTPPNKAIEISVVAEKWNWTFTHSNGAYDSDLHVPVNMPIRLVMTSKDVLHSFYAPVMRVKQDVIPRRYTYAWFLPTKPGTYRLTCAEFCGTNHSQMACREFDKETGVCKRRAVLVVHKSEADYARYLADMQALTGNADPEKLGAMVYANKCVSCHTVDGSARIGPTFAKAYGKMHKMDDGSEVMMDENYIRESLMTPSAKTVAGFPKGTMPPFEGQLKEKEINGLIEYIKSLK